MILSEDKALELVKLAANSTKGRVAIDTETNGKEVRDGRGYAYGVSLAFEHGGFLHSLYLPFRHTNPGSVGNYALQTFLPALQEIIDRNVVVYFNAKFDLTSLQTLGLHPEGRNFLDVMILCHLVNENRPFEKSLENCGQMYVGQGKAKSEEFELALKLVGWEGITPEAHAKYAAQDAALTYMILEAILPKLREEQLMPTWERKAQIIELLRQMELNGVAVDVDLCDFMAEEGDARLWEITEAVRKKYKLPDLNLGSPKGLETILIDKLGLPVIMKERKRKDGTIVSTPTFDKDAMKQYEEMLQYRDNNPIAKLVLEYRGWQKSVSSNYKPYVTLLSPDGRLRPNYKLHGTVTGRLSCEQPNLQQIPRSGAKAWNGKMKACFIARPGFTLIECDYSQLEFRLNAAYGEQLNLIEIFADEHRDIFREIAKSLGWERDPTKGFVYSTAYGAGRKRISNVFGVDQDQAQRLIDNFYELYPGLRRANQYAQKLCYRDKKLQLWSGRYRHFDNPKKEAHKALNSIIQGGAADIVEEAMLRLRDAGFNDRKRSFMLLQVHDSVVCEIRDDCLEVMVPQMSQIMSDVSFDMGVKFFAEAKVWGGKKWEPSSNPTRTNGRELAVKV